MKVVKFGGSSMGCTDAVLQAKNIVQSDSSRRFVVVSAPGRACKHSRKVTDLLIEAHTQLCVGERSDSLELALGRFSEMAGHLGVDMKAEIERTREEIHINRCQRDFIVSRGEYLMSILMAKLLGFTFIDATKLIVIKKNGKLDERATRESFARLHVGRAVMGGFFGRGVDGGVRTFPRGGSDYSGAIVAAMLGADVYENFTDTHGIQSANPIIVEGTRTVTSIDYKSLHKLSLGGAYVIFPDCLPLLKSAGVPIVIDNTFAPGERNTLVSSKKAGERFFSITHENRRNIAKNMAEVLVVMCGMKFDYEQLRASMAGLEVYVTSFKKCEIKLLVCQSVVPEVIKRLHATLKLV